MLPQTSSGRWLAGITAGVFSLIAVAIVVALAASGDPEPLPEGSPEAAVQAYVQAIDDGDFRGAYRLLNAESQEACEENEFRSRTHNGNDAGMRIVLDYVDVADDNALVSVNITSFHGDPPFDFSESTHSTLFDLDRVDGAWEIVHAPWPFSGCLYPSPKPTPTPEPTQTSTSVAPTAS